MLWTIRPDDFAPDFEVVGCFIDRGGDILALKRASGKRQEGKLGLPGGKVSEGESLESALVREVFEETGIRLQAEALQPAASVYVEHDDYRIIYHMFMSILDDKPDKIVINPEEHNDFLWMTPQEFLGQNDLMEDMAECIKLVYNL